MAVLLSRNSRVLAMSATGAYGRAQVSFMRSAGTNVVAHASAGRGGTQIESLPAFDTALDAVAACAADTAMVYTPAAGVRDALIECADAGIRLAVVGAEFVPVRDSLYGLAYARERGMWVVGPNTAGMSTPGEALMGAIAPDFSRPGSLGVIGRSGTLTITMTRMLSMAGIGQSTIVHVGGDAVCGRNPHEWLQLFLDDPQTKAVLYLGEIGGTKEYAMRDIIASASKPVITMIVGRAAPAGKRMGHAGAMIGGDRETAEAKSAALRESGAHVARSPAELLEIVRGAYAGINESDAMTGAR